MMKIRGNRLTKMAIVWGFVLLLIGPSRATATGPEFDKIVDDYVASRFAYRPSEGTAAGLHEYDNQLEDLSRERDTADRRAASVPTTVFRAEAPERFRTI